MSTTSRAASSVRRKKLRASSRTPPKSMKLWCVAGSTYRAANMASSELTFCTHAGVPVAGGGGVPGGTFLSSGTYHASGAMWWKRPARSLPAIAGTVSPNLSTGFIASRRKRKGSDTV